jgi:WD40 repeat protein
MLRIVFVYSVVITQLGAFGCSTSEESACEHNATALFRCSHKDGELRNFAFSPSGRYVAAAVFKSDRLVGVRRFDLHRQIALEPIIEIASTSAIKLLPLDDGERCLLHDSKGKIWQVDGSGKLSTMAVPSPLPSPTLACISNDGSAFAIFSIDSCIVFRFAETQGVPIQIASACKIGRVQLSPDGKRLAVLETTDGDLTLFLKVYDVHSGKKLFSETIPRRLSSYDITISRDGTRVAVMISPRGLGMHLLHTCKVWDVDKQSHMYDIVLERNARPLLSSDGKQLVMIGSGEGGSWILRIYGGHDGVLLHELKQDDIVGAPNGHLGFPAVALCNDNHEVRMVFADGLVRSWKP